MLSNNKVIFEAKNVNKTFGPTVALKDVSLAFKRGEIRGLVGENGSGKSTITSIAAGMQPKDNGELYYQGSLWNPESMVEAQIEGISMILQEGNTIPNVTVAQNIFSGREEEFSKFGIINLKKMVKEANLILKDFGIDHIEASDSIDRYSYEDRKLIEIARSVSDQTEILIVDETTTALSLTGREILYKIIHQLADNNKSVVFISHDLEEIIEHCDVITVLRDGEIIGDISHEEMQLQNVDTKIRYMMVGREIGERYYREDFSTEHLNEVALEFKDVTFGQMNNLSFKLHKGEILGIGGLSGSGMRELGRAAFGLERIEKGKVESNGVTIKTPLDAIRNNIGYISKNRDTEALILEGSIKNNIILPTIETLEGKFGYISTADESKVSQNEIDYFQIKAENENTLVNTLSGGNKQKVSFAKWTANDSKIIIMDCPTRGVDVGVKQAMYSLIEQMKKDGRAILMISEELPELIGMSDRIMIINNYEVTKQFERSPDLEETDIIEYMI